jgi:hypothetical protein
MGPSRHVKTVLTQAEPATDMHKTLIRKPELGVSLSQPEIPDQNNTLTR